MTQRQDSAPASSQTSQTQLLTTFQVDREKWARFGEMAKANNRSRGAQIRELIDRSLEEFEPTQEAA